MITGITLENFKAFKERQVVPIRPITLIFGPNSAGKSCIFRALATLKHALATRGKGEPDRVDAVWSSFRLGGWQNLVHGHSEEEGFAIGLQWDPCITRLGQHSVISGTPLWRTSESPHPEERLWRFRRLDRGGGAAITFSLSHGGDDLIRCDFMKRRFAKEDCSQILKRLRSHAIRQLTKWVEASSTRCGSTSPPNLREVTSWLEGAFDIQAIGSKEHPIEINESTPFDPPDIFAEAAGVRDEWELFRGLSWHRADYGESMMGEADAAWMSAIQNRQLEVIQFLWTKWCSTQTQIDPLPRFDALSPFWIHLDPVRERPEYPLDLGSLPDNPQAEPWRLMLLDDSLRRRASKALSKLTEGEVRIEVRTRSTFFSKPDGSNGSETERVDRELCFLQRDGLSLSLHDLGYGISTVLPVVASLTTQRGMLISIEQPELHLHPRMQAELGDLFIDAALRRGEPGSEVDNLNSRFLIETHSEHLILRLLRRIRETTEGDSDDWPAALREACPGGIRPEDIAVLYVKPGDEGAEIVELPVTSDGDFDRPWPSGFFTERAKELY
ncbi:AAA family ATPase [Haloferula sp. A504]|uniref:AAA family ATPase n=1 Tax=Haloferula sp. A504 TaxID=3373601 RepID=UPI0031C2491F|nr:AAA family ATPase [Verrucomicrobiaceae bacterium E54]